MFKVDIFVSDGGPLSLEEMRRAEVVQLGEPPRDVRSSGDVLAGRASLTE